MLGPVLFEVVQATPEGRYLSLDLSLPGRKVSLAMRHTEGAYKDRFPQIEFENQEGARGVTLMCCCVTYLQLADDGLVEILGRSIYAHGNEIATIYVFFSHAAFAFLESRYSFSLESSCFLLLFCFSVLERGVLVTGARRGAEL